MCVWVDIYCVSTSQYQFTQATSKMLIDYQRHQRMAGKEGILVLEEQTQSLLSCFDLCIMCSEFAQRETGY